MFRRVGEVCWEPEEKGVAAKKHAVVRTKQLGESAAVCVPEMSMFDIYQGNK